MRGARHGLALICALYAPSLESSAAVVAATTGYAGRTSQRAPIVFTLSGGYLRSLRFTIYIECPSRHIWRITASSFPPIQIKRSVFAQNFVARDEKATATVRGRVSDGRVRGIVSDRTYEPKERHYCAGTAGFDLRGGSRLPKPHPHPHSGTSTRPGGGSRPPKLHSHPYSGTSTGPDGGSRPPKQDSHPYSGTSTGPDGGSRPPKQDSHP